MKVPATIIWQDQCLKLLDQRVLPREVRYLTIETLEQAVEAIRTLAVRGAPAIGVAAGYALVVSLKNVAAEAFETTVMANARHLKAARPTAVNLAYAVDRVAKAGVTQCNYDALVAEAESIHAEDIEICQAIGEAGKPLIQPGVRVLTHCNAGALAVSGLGTATAPLYLSHEAGVEFKVFADETRPLLQGARLTAWELSQAGIDVTLLCDNAAASLMARGGIDLVLVGTDRVAANGDVANKIGTLGLAVMCDYFDIPFYVACPSSTYDAATPSGDLIEIERRSDTEVVGPNTADVQAYNPAFDVTPARLVTGLITDRGLITTLDEATLIRVFDTSYV
ncbi:MAG: S-methyl-5-thioribose-1-phosphate isomerase [Thiotrichales bacterium]|nr:S-methyl-5-thioribose-1-phosphate isomerase [Thiotrichales bacterium]